MELVEELVLEVEELVEEVLDVDDVEDVDDVLEVEEVEVVPTANERVPHCTSGLAVSSEKI